MAEEVGAIYYDVDFDTSKLTTGANRVNAALDSAQKSADKTDTSFSKVAKTMSGAAKATDEETAALRKLLGQIDPTVASTQRLDSLTKQLGQAFDKGQISASTYEANLKKLDSQYGKLEGSTKQAAVTSEGFGAKLTPLAGAIAGVITVTTLAQWGKMAEQFTLLQARITRLSPDLDTAAASYNSLLQIASKTGSTMADTTKLWESLTTTLKAFGATNTQVLQLTSTLQKIGTIGGSSGEEVARAMRQLQQGLAGGTLRAEEFNSIIENTPELGRQLAKGFGMSMGELRQAMLDGKLSAEKLFEVLLGRTQDVDTEFGKLPRTVSQAANALTTQFGAALAVIDKATQSSYYLAKALDLVAKGVQQSFNPTDQEQLNKLLRDRVTAEEQYAVQVKAGLTNTADATSQRIDKINEEIRAIQNRRVAQQKEESGTGVTKPAKSDKSPEGQKELKRLQDEAAALRVQGLERAQVIAVQKLGINATEQEITQAKTLAAEIYKQKEAESQAKKDKTSAASEATKAANAAAAAARKAANEEKTGIEQNQKAFTKLGEDIAKVGSTAREAAQDAAQLSLNKYATPEQIQTVRDMAGALYDLKTGKDLLAKVDPIAAEQQGYELQLQQLQALNDQKLLSDQRYLELKGQAEREHLEQSRVLQEENFKAAALGNQILMSSIDALGQSATQSLSGLLSGTTSLKDAMGGIANTVLNSVIGAFVQMGVNWVKQQIMMAAAAQATTATQVAGTAAVTTAQVAATGTIAATTTTAAATTGTAVATSMAPAAGLSSIASFGGAAVIGGAALLATMLLAKSFGGGRQYGGGVAANKMYRVNEGGAPEIFNAAGGKQYMMPNTRGEVVSNNDATSGGGGAAAPIVNVNNYTGQGASTSSRFSEADNRYIVDVIVGDMMAGGRTGQATNRVTGTKRAGT